MCRDGKLNEEVMSNLYNKQSGIPVSATMASTLAGKTFQDPEMSSVFLDPATGEGWLEGQTYTRLQLAQTLDTLAEAGPDGDKLFYNGELGNDLVRDLTERGGILTMQDLNYYRAKWSDPLVVPLANSNLTLLTVPPPGSGAVLAAILNIVQVSVVMVLHLLMGKLERA